MPIEVEIPGKGVAEFPEGTDELTIHQAIRKSFPDLNIPGTPSESAFAPEPGHGMSSHAPLQPFTGIVPSEFEQYQAQAEKPEEQLLSRKLETPLVNLPKELYEAPLLKWLAPDISEGLATGTKRAAESMTSPVGLATLPYMAVGGAEAAALKGASVVGRTIAGAFGVQGLTQLPEAAQRYVEAVKQGDQAKAAEAWPGLAATTLQSLGVTGLAGLKTALETPPVIDTMRVPVAHKTVLPAAAETFKEITGEEPTKGPENASENKVAATLGGEVLRNDEGRQAPGGMPVNESSEGIRPQTEGRIPRQETEVAPEISKANPAAESEVQQAAAPAPAAPTPPVEGRGAPTIANTGISPETLRSSPVTTPSAPETRPLGIVAPSSLSFIPSWLERIVAPLREAKRELSWRTFAQQTLPEWTRTEREVGEAGARYASAHNAAEMLGRRFARDVLSDRADDPVFDRQLGTAIKEDNLRSIRKGYQDKADEARAKAAANPNAAEAYEEDAKLYDDAASAVVTLVGGKNSPFRDEAAYRSFLDDPATQEAIQRYKQLWVEQKEPMFREAAGIDPETELAGRGLETGARINLTFAKEGEGIGGKRIVQGKVVGTGGQKVRQLGTLLRRDPFLRQATGTGTSYHASLSDTMADAFAREYPVAAQHEFIRRAIESGVAKVGKDYRPPEGYRSYPLKLNPWRGQNLYVPEHLAGEYEALVGLSPGMRIPVVTPTASVLTRQSIMGLGEGTAHSANILLKLATGITTKHPIMEALASVLPGRPDFFYALGKALFHGLRNESDAMLDLAKINAAKRPYEGPISSRFLNPLDQGVRIISKDVFKGLAEAGIVKDTETNLREFVNEIGNYTQSVQSPMVRNLRSSQIQPFATGFRTAKVQAVKRLALAPGLEAQDAMNAAFLRATILGKFIGTAATVATINYLISGKARGYQGTPLGSISWKDKDDKVHYWDLGGFMGATTGAKALGVMGVIEGKERNLSTSSSLKQGARSAANTLISQVAGPAVRATTIGISGKDPYGFQIADVSPPTDDLLRSQAVKNIEAALQSINPVADMALSVHEGKTWDEIRQRQLTRYATRQPSSLATSDRFTEVVEKKNLMEYSDWLASRTRKMPLEDRSTFIRKKLEDDKVTGPSYKEVQMELRRKGIYRYR